MKVLLCTCGVVSGGYRAYNATCPIHGTKGANAGCNFTVTFNNGRASVHTS